MSKLSYGLCVALVTATVTPALGTVILPEDDATWRGTSRYNATSVFGLFTKGDGTSDRAYLEFPLDTTTATSATLKLYNYWTSSQHPVDVNVRIRGISDSEAGYQAWTEEAGPAPSGQAHESWTIVVNSFHVGNTAQWYTFDITSFYNANLGDKVTLSVRSLQECTPGADGPIFEDKEGTGGTAYAPCIEWVPEPASLLLMAGAGVFLVRRRRA